MHNHPNVSDMKKILFLLILALSLPIHAQQYAVESKEMTSAQLKSDISGSFNKAGTHLQKSSTFDMLSWTMLALSAYSFSNASNDKDGYGKTVGTISAVLAFGSKILAVHYKYQSGMELKLGAGSLSLTF